MLARYDCLLVAVPTPVGAAHVPDLGPLIRASRVIGEQMRAGATIVYEATVYPGTTEEVCIPELERAAAKRFKENCADLRNSKVADVVHELRGFGVEVHVHDPEADPVEAECAYGISLMEWSDLPRADALVMAVPHRSLLRLTAEDLSRKLIRGGCVIEVKAALERAPLRDAGLRVWGL